MNRAPRFLVPLLGLFGWLTGTAIAADAPADIWRIQFQGRATGAGEVHFKLTPQGGEPIVITVKINSGRGEMYMAKDLLEDLQKQLPRARFKSEIIHIQEVLLKARNGEPAFALELVDSTVVGPRIILGPA